MNVGIGLSVSNFSSVPTVALNPDDLIAALFSSGEEGAWYDPSDLTTLYQDAAGTTPVTGTGQPVGLMLDKSKGLTLGSELVPQPIDFSADWTATPGGAPTSSGSSFTTSAIGGFWIQILTAGKAYSISVAGSTTASGITVRQTDKTTTSQIMSGFGEATFAATSPYTWFYIRNESAGTTNISSLTVKQISGNHATQSTSTARPTLQLDGSSYYLDFDGVDDFLDAPDIAGLEGISEMSVCLGATIPSGTAQQSPVSKWNVGGFSWLIDYYLSVSRFAIYGTSSGNRAEFSVTRDNSDIVSVYRFKTSNGYLNINGSSVASNSDTIDATVTANNDAPVTIGAKKDGPPASAFFNGNIYGLIIRSADLDAAELAATESYLATKSGVTLP